MALNDKPQISTVIDINLEGFHFHEDKKFNNYIVWLDDYDEPLRMTKCMATANKRDIPEKGNVISYTLDGYRLKNVKCLKIVNQ